MDCLSLDLSEFAVDQDGEQESGAAVGGPCVAGAALNDDLAWLQARLAVVEDKRGVAADEE